MVEAQEIQNSYELNNSNLITQKSKNPGNFGKVVNMFGNKLNSNNSSKYKPQPFDPPQNDYSDAYLQQAINQNNANNNGRWTSNNQPVSTNFQTQ